MGNFVAIITKVDISLRKIWMKKNQKIEFDVERKLFENYVNRLLDI